MKKIYLLFTLVILLLSCEKEEFQTPLANEAKQETGVQSVEFKDIPDKILKNLTGKKISKHHKNTVNFGQVRKDIPAFINKDKTGTTYTIALAGLNKNSKSIGDLYFDNLVVHELPDGEIGQYVFRYTPDISWYRGSRDLENYSGGIAFFELNGNKLGQIKIVHGQMEKQDSTTTKTGCTTFILDHVVCIDAGDSGSPYCTYYYTRSCDGGGGDPTSGGDGFPNPNDGTGDPSWGDGGDSPSGGGDPGTGGGGPAGPGTTPIIDENGELISAECQAGQEPNLFGVCVDVDVKIENNLSDPCASLVFNQLQLISMDYDLPPDVSNPNNLGEDPHFTEAILNIFNDSQEYDYIVKEDSNLYNYQTGSTNPQIVWNPTTERHEITSRFNPDYFQNATDLSMARTIIHEAVHAFLLYSVKDQPMGSIREALSTYIEDNGMSNQVNNTLHHNFMAQFVNAIAYNLKLWDSNHGTGGTLGWQYYHDMAWGGLGIYADRYGNKLFYQEYLDNTTSTERIRIEKIIQNEASNTNNSSQSGNENNCQ